VLAGAAAILLGVAGSLAAQDLPLAPPPVDSIVVEGNSRLTSEQIATAAGIVLGGTISYRDVQRSIRRCSVPASSMTSASSSAPPTPACWCSPSSSRNGPCSGAGT
jgi:hypothetical protein